ncbi:MAG: HdeD family acid-resistance protein [Gammaproteobacteria bacterium]
MAEEKGVDFQSLAQDAGLFCKRTWWMFLIGGIASVIFGLLAFARPGIALLVLGIFFAAYLLVDGVVSVWGAVTHRDKDGWWLVLLVGVLSVVLGAYLIAVPPASMLALVYVVAFIALFIGVTSVSLGWKVRKAVTGEWVLYLIGALSILFSLLILFNPGAGSLSVIYMIASWAIIIGLLRIWFAFRVKNLPEQVATRVREAAAHRP